MSREPVKPLPFPGESPTVALALAAGQKYGLPPEDEKPARARPKRRAATKKTTARKAAKPVRKTAPRRKPAGAKSRAR